jgi:flagellar hook protein FlgE
MALTSALFTGLSGLDAAQTWINVIGNNIANVNTTAFKSSQVQFSPQFYVTDQAGTTPDGDFGGTNPSQEGMGTQIANITEDFTPGSIQSTGVDTDLAVNGSGFFIVNSNAGQQYTRNGSFTLNSTNQLVSATGAYVQGYGADANGNILAGALQNITIPLGQQTVAKATQNVSMEGNLNSGGQVAAGATILTSQALTTIGGGAAPTNTTDLVDVASASTPNTALVNVGDVLTLSGTRGSAQLPSSSLTVTGTTTVNDLQNFINDSLGIDTTVSEPGNPTPGATLQTTGNTAQLTIIGNTGTANAITLGSSGLVDTTAGTTPFTMSGGTDGSFTNDPVGESTSTQITAYDSLGTPVTVNLTAVLEGESNAGDTWRFYASSPDNMGGNGPVLGNGTLTFDTAGQLVASTGTTMTINRSGTGATTPLVVNLNFGSMTDFSSTSSNMVMASQDGSAVGTLTSFSIGSDGTISGTFSNGLSKTLGQVALANFANPDGLVDEGNSNYEAGANSGVATIGAPTTQGTGTLQAGALEQSNVDLSKEFINLIIASTGFSSASKVISTSDELLTDLLNSQH